MGDIATQLGTAIVIIVIPLIAITFLDATPFEIGLLAASERLPFIIFSLIAGDGLDLSDLTRVVLQFAGSVNPLT